MFYQTTELSLLSQVTVDIFCNLILPVLRCLIFQFVTADNIIGVKYIALILLALICGNFKKSWGVVVVV